MFAQVNSLGLFGMNAFAVQVEIDISRGQPMFEVVGLPDAAVRESRERIKSALRACGVAFPVARVMVNLAPANTKKTGSVYDLAILMAILQATGRLPALPKDSCFLGEVSLNGSLRPVNGVLPMVLLAREQGIRQIFLPADNAYEASVASGIAVYGVENVSQLLDHFDGEHALTPQPAYVPTAVEAEPVPDFSDVRGQNFAKRALEIAAAGGHNTLLIGTPGSGKSMLAKRMPGILPEMTFGESIQTTNIHSVAGLLDPRQPLVTVRPFRSPHHTISAAGLAGGGSIPHPGEISLAHNGLLFLDELAEFDRRTLEILRQPLEDHTVTISRASGTITYPCTIMLIAAMNPCPCGYYGHPQRKCTCSQNQVQQYLSKVSGPLLDRFDLHVDVAPVCFEDLTGTGKEESSADIRERVQAARKIQQQRFTGTAITCNAQITPDLLRTYCPMTDRAQQRLKDVFERMGLSARAYDRLLKVARTIADLDGVETLDLRHVTEAVQYRSLDRKYKTHT